MTKELEDRLKVLNEFEKYEGNLEHLSSSNILNVFNELENNLKCIENAYKDRILSLIRKALTPPTAEEVCEALNEHLEGEIIYDWENKRFEFEIDGTEVVRMTWRGTVRLNSSFPPHLIVLIGRFYEGLGK